jgi:hypothetical protein
MVFDNQGCKPLEMVSRRIVNGGAVALSALSAYPVGGGATGYRPVDPMPSLRDSSSALGYAPGVCTPGNGIPQNRERRSRGIISVIGVCDWGRGHGLSADRPNAIAPRFLVRGGAMHQGFAPLAVECHGSAVQDQDGTVGIPRSVLWD